MFIYHIIPLFVFQPSACVDVAHVVDEFHLNISDVVVDAKLSKSKRELKRQPQKLKAAEASNCMTNSVGVGGSGVHKRQRRRCLARRLSARKLSCAINNKTKKINKKKKMKEKILKLISFHHYKMKQDMFDLINGSFSSRLCLLILIFLVRTSFVFEYLFNLYSK